MHALTGLTIHFWEAIYSTIAVILTIRYEMLSHNTEAKSNTSNSSL
jgi:hypothetical protein